MSTLLNYTKAAFTPFTKIVSADVNQFFSDIKSRFNWAGGTDAATGLGDENIQGNAATGGGLTRNTKLKAGTANYCVINDSNGKMTEEQFLSTSRGGAGQSIATANAGDVPIYSGSTYAPGPPVPSGVIMPYGGTAAPTGYLLCDGTSYLRATYPTLFTAISTAYGTADGTHFNVPDLRGKFLRGVSGSTSNDPDRASRTANNTGGATGNNVGSQQGFATQAHTHDVAVETSWTHAGSQIPGIGNVGDGSGTGAQTTTSETGTTSTETRPSNVYVNYIIKT